MAPVRFCICTGFESTQNPPCAYTDLRYEPRTFGGLEMLESIARSALTLGFLAACAAKAESKTEPVDETTQEFGLRDTKLRSERRVRR